MKTPIRNLLFSFLSLLAFSTGGLAQGNFVYVNNSTPSGPNKVSAFSIGANGTLLAVPGSPFITGGNGQLGGFFAKNRVAVLTIGGFLFVSNAATSNVSAFAINPSNGALTSVAGSPFATGGQGDASITSTPDGRFLVAASTDSSNLTVFTIAGNGALTPVPGSPFPCGGGPDGIKIAPNGKFLAVALQLSDAIAMFSITSNGSLSPVPGSPFTTPGPGAAAGVDINCESNLLFVGEAVLGLTSVDVFSIAANGGLTPVQGSPFVVSSGFNSNIVLLSTDERFLFVSNQSSRSITVFSVAANGTLTPAPGSPFKNGGSPGCSQLGLATDQSGTHLYNIDFCGNLYGYGIAANGVLTLVPGAPFATIASLGSPGVAVYPAKSCATFDLCIQDDSSGSTLKINSTTGDYLFTSCSGSVLGGRGTITRRGSTIALQHFAIDRRVICQFDGASKRATASVQVFPPGITATLADRNTGDNTCVCR